MNLHTTAQEREVGSLKVAHNPRDFMTTAATDVWYRFGKEDNRVTEVSFASMRRSAYGNFAAPDKTIALGRFETPTLLYVRADKLTAPESERVHKSAGADD